MDIIGLIKDAVTVVQKADNVSLEKQLLDIEQQAFDLMNENRLLREQIAALQDALKIKDDIERHEEPYVTLKTDSTKLPYCATCYSTTGKFIQMIDFHEGIVTCPSCRASFSKYPSDSVEEPKRG